MEEHQQDAIHAAVAARRAKEQQEEQLSAAYAQQMQQLQAATRAQIAESEPWVTALLRELALAEWGMEAVVEWEERPGCRSAFLSLFSRDSHRPRIYRIDGCYGRLVRLQHGAHYYEVRYLVDTREAVTGFDVEGKVTMSARPAIREALAQALAQVAQEGPGYHSYDVYSVGND